jgi:hypothetical protein
MRDCLKKLHSLNPIQSVLVCENSFLSVSILSISSLKNVGNAEKILHKSRKKKREINFAAINQNIEKF